MVAMIALVIQLVEWAGVIVGLVSAWAIWRASIKGFTIILKKENDGIPDESCGCDPPCRTERP